MIRNTVATLLAASLAACSQAEAESDSSARNSTAETRATPKFTQLDQDFDTPFPGHDTKIILGQSDLPSQLSLLEVEVAPRSVGAPPHQHSAEDEVFIVTEGAVTFLNGEEEVEAGKGTVASLPRGHFHGFWNPHDEPARMLLLINPGGFDSFFDEVVQQVRADNADNPAAIGAIIGQKAAERGVTVDPSRFPPSAQALLAPPPEG